MPQLLLELFSEEIPARMQGGAARDLARMATERLKGQELAFDRLETFVTPRRLCLVVDGLPTAQADRSEERKGPKASAPEQAVAGFLRSTGLARDQLVERDGVLFATLHRPGRPTPEIVSEMVVAICADFPWPKSMRSGASSFRWVRPLRSMILLFDGEVVPCEVGGIAAGMATRGHRFMGGLKGDPFDVSDFADYRGELAEQCVTLDPAERRRVILARGQAVCADAALELVPDDGLLDEVTGLVEHPVPLLGEMDPAFLDLPPEVIRTSMRTHQRYFAVRDPATGKLAPRFVVVANIEASDGGEEIRAGNAKVLSARLNDARFFWDEDRKPGAFERWAEKLKGVTFHAKLGTMAERVERIAALAREIAPAVGADPDEAEKAARLSKLDLASAMVGEFPELQGVMGGYYLREGEGASPPQSSAAPPTAPPQAGEPGTNRTFPARGGGGREADGGGDVARRDRIADAARDHYKPVGPSDSVPTAPVTVAVALADKLDTLVGFFAIDEKPTGSRDPYALRRAALGVTRLILGNRLRLSLRKILTSRPTPVPIQGILSREFLASAQGTFSQILRVAFRNSDFDAIKLFLDKLGGYDPPEFQPDEEETVRFVEAEINCDEERPFIEHFVDGLLAFLADRLKVQLREEGKRHDLVDAVFALGDDDLVRIVDRVEALSGFLATEDGTNLLAGYKRAVNILRAEAKKNPDEVVAPLDTDHPAQGATAEEQALAETLSQVSIAIRPLIAAEDFVGAMKQLARLRAPVDAFFDRVLVNDPYPGVRLGRLRLLASLQATANQVADFSLVQG